MIQSLLRKLVSWITEFIWFTVNFKTAMTKELLNEKLMEAGKKAKDEEAVSNSLVGSQ